MHCQEASAMRFLAVQLMQQRINQTAHRFANRSAIAKIR